MPLMECCPSSAPGVPAPGADFYCLGSYHVIQLEKGDDLMGFIITPQTPVIAVNGSRYGRTLKERHALAEAIREILAGQTAAQKYLSESRLQEQPQPPCPKGPELPEGR